MIKLLLCGFIAGIISVAFNSIVIGLIVGIVLLTIFASINVKNIANRKHNEHGKTEHFCSRLGIEIDRDFYCARGVRKDGENNA